MGQWYVSRGRISRKTWWLHYVLPVYAALVVALLISQALGLAEVSTSAGDGTVSASANVGPIVVVVYLLTIVPMVSAMVTRLHDRGHSAWWLLINLVPVFGSLFLFVQMGFLPGDEQANQYGPSAGAVAAPAGFAPAY